MALAGTWACIEDVPYQWTLKDSIQSHSALSFVTGRFHRSSSCICFFSLHGDILINCTTGNHHHQGLPFGRIFLLVHFFCSDHGQAVATSPSLPTNCHSPAMTLPGTTFLEEMPPNSDLWGGFLLLTEILQVGWDFSGWIWEVLDIFGNKKKHRWYHLLDLNVGEFPGFGGLIQGQIYNLAIEASN